MNLVPLCALQCCLQPSGIQDLQHTPCCCLQTLWTAERLAQYILWAKTFHPVLSPEAEKAWLLCLLYMQNSAPCTAQRPAKVAC